MTIANDLATLRALQTAVEYLLAGGIGRRDEIARLLEDAPGAARRMEAEIARLEQEWASIRGANVELAGERDSVVRTLRTMTLQAQAAEAEAARLRDGLRQIATDSDQWCEAQCGKAARALLAENESDGREPDGYRVEGGRVIPTDR